MYSRIMKMEENFIRVIEVILHVVYTIPEERNNRKSGIEIQEFRCGFRNRKSLILNILTDINTGGNLLHDEKK